MLVGLLEIYLCSSFPPNISDIEITATAKSLGSATRGSLNFLGEQEWTALRLDVRNEQGARRD
jgi:hypothetical protein